MYLHFIELYLNVVFEGTDEEEVIINAFKMFDEDGQGYISVDKQVAQTFRHLMSLTDLVFNIMFNFALFYSRLRRALVTWGDKFTDDEVNILLFFSFFF